MDQECIIWCPDCKKDCFTVERRPTRASGVFEHVLIGDADDHKRCKCGCNLERRENG